MLAKLFSVQRHQLQGKVPLAFETKSKELVEPLLVLSTKQDFILSRKGSDGTVRSGVSYVPLESEDLLLGQLYRKIDRISKDQQWGNRVDTIDAGIAKVKSFKVQPKWLVVSLDLLVKALGKKITLEEVKVLMRAKGNVGTYQDLDILVAPNFAAEQAMITVDPNSLGQYIRFGDYLTLTVHNVSKNIILIGSDGLA